MRLEKLKNLISHLTKSDFKYTSPHYEHNTLLEWAIQSNHSVILRLILNHPSINIHFINPITHLHPLEVAAKLGSLDTFDLLLMKYSDKALDLGLYKNVKNFLLEKGDHSKINLLEQYRPYTFNELIQIQNPIEECPLGIIFNAGYRKLKTKTFIQSIS